MSPDKDQGHLTRHWPQGTAGRPHTQAQGSPRLCHRPEGRTATVPGTSSSGSTETILSNASFSPTLFPHTYPQLIGQTLITCSHLHPARRGRGYRDGRKVSEPAGSFLRMRAAGPARASPAGWIDRRDGHGDERQRGYPPPATACPRVVLCGLPQALALVSIQPRGSQSAHRWDQSWHLNQ